MSSTIDKLPQANHNLANKRRYTALFFQHMTNPRRKNFRHQTAVIIDKISLQNEFATCRFALDIELDDMPPAGRSPAGEGSEFTIRDEISLQERTDHRMFKKPPKTDLHLLRRFSCLSLQRHTTHCNLRSDEKKSRKPNNVLSQSFPRNDKLHQFSQERRHLKRI